MSHSTIESISAVFDGEGALCSASALEQALESLLERYPHAPVAAMDGDGAIVAMPDSIRLRQNTVLEARAGGDLVVLDEESLAGWDRILTRGASVYRVHPAAHPDATWTLYGLDLRASHEIVFVLGIPDEAANGSGGEGSAPVDLSKEFAARSPRCATARKDQRAMILSVDAAATQLLGWTAEQMVGHRSSEFIHHDDQTLAHDAWMEMLASSGPGRRVRVRHRRADGSWLWLELVNQNLLRDPDEGCVLCEMVDISEEMAAHELLNRLAEAVPVGLLQLDRDGRVVYSNDRLHEILGVQRMDTMRAQLSSFAAEQETTLIGAIEGVLGDGGPVDLETELLHPVSGESRFCTVAVRGLGDGKGAISGAIVCVSDITESIHMREELRRRSTYDELTGCLNRATIMQALHDHLGDAQETDGCAVIFVDLDCFKPINDELGHAAGDELLSAVARRLRGALREDDAIGRIGGDEFLIVSPRVSSGADALRLAERVARTQDAEIELASAGLRVRFSIGVAWSPGCDEDADAMVARADDAMYQSKSAGLGRPQLADALTAAAADKRPRRSSRRYASSRGVARAARP